jgi:hypothetical protein
MINRHPWGPFAAGLAVYLVATAVIGRDVLAHLSTTAIHDAGDPLLTAAILHWTTTHLPLTHGWWQFPIFYPTADTMAFSEHLLGLSVIATPIEWLTGSVPVMHNLVALLTYPLCGATMYALVRRLTHREPAAFIAGLLFAFAPYRISQLPHIQMLAVFWAPLSLLGLHAYLESRRRRWLVLFGIGWMMQAAANGYCLFFFSVLVGLWVLWFVVARRDWRGLRDITVAALLAVLPLVPILYTYVVVHARNGFARSFEEVQVFSADVAALLCAPELLTFWGWVRVQCGPEGELFPGVAAFALFVAGAGLVLWTRSPASRLSPRLAWTWRLLAAVAAAYALAAATILVFGPWRVDLGIARLTVSTLERPLLIGVPALIAAMALSPRVRTAAIRRRNLAFYVVAAISMWLLALGPRVTVMGRNTGARGPFELLMLLPGADGLRVPARFWIMSIFCLAVVGGFVIEELLAKRGRRVVAVVTAAIALGVLSDGWVNPIPAIPLPVQPFPAATLKDRVVMSLPIGDDLDIPTTYFAVTGGWTSVNGYSGYHPSYYPALNYAVRFEQSDAFVPFLALTDLDVIVAKRAPRLIALVERQSGVQVVTELENAIHYRLPRRGRADDGRTAGMRLPIARVSSGCVPALLSNALDGDRKSRWTCGPTSSEQTIEIDLGTAETIGAVVNAIGPYDDQFPPRLVVETSLDRETWSAAWDGSLVAQAIRGGMDEPKSMRIVIPFTPRRARYVRVRHPAGEDYYWTISELEAWSANTGIPPNPEASNRHPD